MKYVAGLLFFASVLFPVSSPAQQRNFVVKEELSNQWLAFSAGKYSAWHADNDAPISTVYSRIEPLRYTGDYLQLSGYQHFSLFINGRLVVADVREATYSLDSLRKLFPEELVMLLAVHHSKTFRGDLKMNIVTPFPVDQHTASAVARPPTFFRDFVIVALMVLLILTAVIVRLNPKLASDYFSVSRIFSMREIDDSQVYTRISSSTNILFYLEGSLMIAFCLMVIFDFTLPFRSIGYFFQSGHFWSAVWQWIELTLIILTIFLLKILLVYGTSYLFGLKEVAGIHFFNWVRILLLSFSTITVIIFIYFISRGQSPGFYNTLVGIITAMLIVVAAVVFLKLKGRMGYSFFHLFSYICATELIPLLITVKLLYQ